VRLVPACRWAADPVRVRATVPCATPSEPHTARRFSQSTNAASAERTHSGKAHGYRMTSRLCRRCDARGASRSAGSDAGPSGKRCSVTVGLAQPYRRDCGGSCARMPQQKRSQRRGAGKLRAPSSGCGCAVSPWSAFASLSHAARLPGFGVHGQPQRTGRRVPPGRSAGRSLASDYWRARCHKGTAAGTSDMLGRVPWGTGVVMMVSYSMGS